MFHKGVSFRVSTHELAKLMTESPGTKSSREQVVIADSQKT